MRNGEEAVQGNVEELNDGGSHKTNYGITQLGTYGPETSDDNQKVTTVDGDVNIDIPGAESGDIITLRNLDIKGNLNVDFGDGNLILDNVKLNGVDIANIGAHSLYIRGNTSIGLLTINDSNGNARVVVEGNGNVYNTSLKSGAKLEVASGASHRSPFANIVIAPTGENGDDEITLDGKFDNIKVASPSKVNIASGTSIRNQISIESSVELSVAENVTVSRVEISNTTVNDKVSLSGNLSNVNVNSNANIEVKSGAVTIAASADAGTVNVSVAEGASVETGRGTIETSGAGDVNKKENLSSEAKILDNTFEEAHAYTDQNGDSRIYGVPSGITVADLLSNLVISNFATASVVDETGNSLGASEHISTSKMIRVTSEDGDVNTDYTIDFAYSYGGHDNWLMGLGYDHSIYQNRFELDSNSEKGKYSAEVKFNGLEDQSIVDGYYLGIQGRKVEEKDGIKDLYHKMLYEIFIPKTENRDYTAQLQNVDLKGYSMLNLVLRTSIANRASGGYHNGAYDAPVLTEAPSVAGIVISDFQDTNAQKGKIEGKIEFTKATDESNIAYYDVVIKRGYERSDGGYHSWHDRVGLLEPGDDTDGVYSIGTRYPIGVGRTDDISIVVIPVNKDGIEADYATRPEKKIVDNPAEEVLEVQKPRLNETLGRDYSLTVSNTLQGSDLRLYKYDSAQSDFVLYKRSGSEIIAQGSGHSTNIDKLEVGRYKVTQTTDGITSEMSAEALVRPMKLSGILQNGELSLVNAIDGATITVYDSAGAVVETIEKKSGETPVIDTTGYTSQTYSITQTVDEIASSKFVVPLGGEFTISDIDSSIIAALNKANIDASIDENRTITLKKKADGSIGNIVIDTGAYVDVHFDGSISAKVEEKLGTSYIQNTSRVEFSVESDFDTLATEHGEFWVYLTFEGQQYSYKVVMEKEVAQIENTESNQAADEETGDIQNSLEENTEVVTEQ